MTYVDDSADWPFEAGAGEMIVFIMGAPAPTCDIREALNNPRLSIEDFSELMQDRAFQTIAELTNARTIAIEAAQRLTYDLTAARGMLLENDLEALDELLGAMAEQADNLFAELTEPDRDPAGETR
jgi:hypothetical protein